ncbi:Piso0_003469 [Millerozyma farinosa CBS 7064]|uniref:Piso0_003469 protein n=1 Tax=Pichia sorbitophila (strain ATCC MYA-4447 / BCRC 22081 / CBS 7064 / NBRC 10061 / NRRL Y-12695) TaxID=559304 RepID=G8YJ58_PICSO|nr:Piso0_003469 [Millerozyma farinosa CBS 7064]CCE81118.1 Piso0_003469 [Millerozyma farinosa CBS 7064]
MSTSGEDPKKLINEYVRDNKYLLVKQFLAENPRLALAKDDDERTPLHWACSINNTEMVQLLIDNIKNVDIDEITDESGWTPVHIASSLGNEDIIDSLMKLNPTPDIDLATTSGTTALHLAISKNHYDLVKKLITVYKASCRTKDKKGFTGLHRAASIGSQPIIKLIVEHGKVNINAKDMDGWTSLHHALAEGHGDAAVLLVGLGADPSITNGNDETPAQVAVDEKVRKYFETHI